MGQRIFLALRGIVYATGFFFVAVWLVPALINIRISFDLPSRSAWRIVGALPLLIGAAIVVWCFVNFVEVGKGTPAPFDAPRRLVVNGPYCYVRNPMYIGGLLFLSGYAFLFTQLSFTLLCYALILIMGVNLFIFFYEEPTLRRKFAGDYEEYCRNVSRWMPRIRPWRSRLAAAANTAS